MTIRIIGTQNTLITIYNSRTFNCFESFLNSSEKIEFSQFSQNNNFQTVICIVEYCNNFLTAYFQIFLSSTTDIFSRKHFRFCFFAENLKKAIKTHLIYQIWYIVTKCRLQCTKLKKLFALLIYLTM